MVPGTQCFNIYDTYRTGDVARNKPSCPPGIQFLGLVHPFADRPPSPIVHPRQPSALNSLIVGPSCIVSSYIVSSSSFVRSHPSCHRFVFVLINKSIVEYVILTVFVRVHVKVISFTKSEEDECISTQLNLI